MCIFVKEIKQNTYSKRNEKEREKNRAKQNGDETEENEQTE